MEKKSFFIQEKIDGFELLIIKSTFKRMQGLKSSALVIYLFERLITPNFLVKRNDVADVLRRRFLKRLFFLRKIRSGQNIPNLYPHPLFFNLHVDISSLQHLFNRMMHCGTSPKMQPHNTIAMKPQVIKKLREMFMMLFQSRKDFGLLMTCADGYFIKIHLSPDVETQGFMMDLKIFHETKGIMFFYKSVPVNLLHDEVNIHIFLQTLENDYFQFFYTDNIRLPLFTSEIPEYKNFKIEVVSFFCSVPLAQSSRKRKCFQDAPGMNKRFCCMESLFEEMNAMWNQHPDCLSKRMKGMCLAPDA